MSSSNICMDWVEQEYNGDGKNEMDKAYYESFPAYSHKNHTLVVESSFSEEMTIQQLIKQCLIEQKSKIELDDFSKAHYNESGNIAVVASTKEGSE